MSTWQSPEPNDWWGVVEVSLAEDIGTGDVSVLCIPEDQITTWYIEAQADGVVCGLGIVEQLLAPTLNDPESFGVEAKFRDGDRISRGDILIQGRTLARRVLTLERTALNFMMHLSGVASLTRRYVDLVEGTGCRIVDTRKTLPGLRSLQKYAVRCGGGFNHRMGLYDGAMIKDNHIAANGSIREAVELLRSKISHMTRIEVECESPEQVREAVEAGADVILLDNMDPFTMRDVVRQFKGRAVLEASGGINLETVAAVANTGVDVISVGALTHSATGLAMHLEFR